MCWSLFYGPRYSLSWYMFYGHLKRMCILSFNRGLHVYVNQILLVGGACSFPVKSFFQLSEQYWNLELQWWICLFFLCLAFSPWEAWLFPGHREPQRFLSRKNKMILWKNTCCSMICKDVPDVLLEEEEEMCPIFITHTRACARTHTVIEMISERQDSSHGRVSFSQVLHWFL